LSFHPGQFVVLASQQPGVREKAFRELVYHCDVFEKMGYTKWHEQGASVNIHVGVKDANISAMRKLLKSNSNVLKFTTLENDEFSWGAREILNEFGDLLPLVLDIHHYWINRERRLNPKSPLLNLIRESWRGIQPKLHLAMSKLELCGNAKPTDPLCLKTLLKNSTKGALRAHSDFPWHTKSIDYAAKFGFDILWEGKDKNLGSTFIAKHLKLL
jgi:UV DNA damage endonuclease